MSRKLKLIIGDVEITGCGEQLALRTGGYRKKKTGAYEYFDLDLVLDRWIVNRLMDQIAAMHERDRERLRTEARRIDLEIAAVQPEKQS